MISEELKSKIDKSIQRLQTFCPPEGYYLAFSGGKDSCVCKALLDMSGCKYDAHYRVTGIDPPELVKFIKEYHPDVAREIPRYADGTPKSMWNLIVRHRAPPTRIIRYCCAELKEDGGDGRMVVTGVRWAESKNRKDNQGQVTVMKVKSADKAQFLQTEGFADNKRGGVILTNDNEDTRRMVEQCYKRNKTTVNPIIEWTDKDVWDFIHEYNIPYCSLYDEGFQRLGCIGCPMAGFAGRQKEFARWPKIKNAYLMAFEKMLRERELACRIKRWVAQQQRFTIGGWKMEFCPVSLISLRKFLMDLIDREEVKQKYLSSILDGCSPSIDTFVNVLNSCDVIGSEYEGISKYDLRQTVEAMSVYLKHNRACGCCLHRHNINKETHYCDGCEICDSKWEWGGWKGSPHAVGERGDNYNG